MKRTAHVGEWAVGIFLNMKSVPGCLLQHRLPLINHGRTLLRRHVMEIYVYQRGRTSNIREIANDGKSSTYSLQKIESWTTGLVLVAKESFPQNGGLRYSPSRFR